ncbi:hypothetical protein D6777_02065 [Candidatus Woesearchaeota archaeon]|nr:MAG: hypothetical protein D6777_02065 [Candidatus Woesearchaeota archaeon]
MSEENDEITVDFSKITRFFKGKRKQTKESSGEEQSEESEDEGEMSIDYKKIAFYVKKYSAVILILIPLILSINFRMYPANLPIMDKWAKDTVYNNIRAGIAQEIMKQYPTLPRENLAREVEKKFQELLASDKGAIESQIKQTSNYFKSRFQDDDGQTYLLAIDPYTYYRSTRNIIEKGMVGDEIRKGQEWNNHILAPIGVPAKKNFHIVVGVYFYKIWHFFDEDVSLMKTFFYITVVMSALSVFPAFFIARRIGGKFAGFFAAVLVAVHPVFIGRTSGGFSDTDAYNVLFPLLIVWMFFEAFYAKTMKKRLAYVGLAGFFVGLYSYTWSGWWYPFFFLLGTSGVYILYNVVIKLNKTKNLIKIIKELKQVFVILAVFVVFSGIFVSAFAGPDIFVKSVAGPLKFRAIKNAAHKTLWPNVYTTVAELNPASFKSVINQIGFGGKSKGRFMFSLAVLGIILAFVRKDKNKSMNVLHSSLLLIWFFATIYASLKGSRFLLLLVPAFSIACGVATGIIYYYLSRWLESGLSISQKISKPIIIILFCVLLITPVKAGHFTALNEVPSMNDAWYATLTKIKEESKENAIINSWWDFGHWFKAIADRPVTFDGGSQNTPIAHWIGRVLMTNNEREAIGILRMLDCGSNLAFETLYNYTNNDTHKSLDIIYNIIELKKEDAKEILKVYGFSDDEVRTVLNLTHCNPPEDYFITSQDMIGKSGVWAHFGGWDFKRADAWINVKGMRKSEAIKYLTEKLGYNEDEANDIYFKVLSMNDEKDANTWISGWPSYLSSLTSCNINDKIVSCGNGAKVNFSSMEATVSSKQGTALAKKLVYVDEDGEFKVIEYENGTADVAISLIPSGNGYRSVLTSSVLGDSMFNRLFFFRGHGLKYFDFFDHQKQVSGGDIYVWKVDWNGTDENVVYKKVEENELNETTQI